MLKMFVLLLFISIQNLHALICHSNGSFYFSRNEFNWNNFSSILLNIENQIISNSSYCHVRITVDYNSNENNYVIIKFNSPINHYKTNIEFGSTINFYKNEIQSIISYLDYTCLSENFCDKNFLNKWAKQLLDTNNNSLHTSFISLWKNSSSTSDICNSKQIINQCESYLCFIIYDELKNLSYGKSQCNDKLSTNPVYIHIKTHGEYSNDYQCIKNHCTNQVKYNSILEKNHTEKIIINKIQKNLDELHKIIFIRTITIVGILLFIGCIAYYIQTREYRQGYRLATIA
ncbi:unnamed protein product [Rotaria sordida]|uniref:Uncharacterized protein n=2 Tax=Rotaria sordida TaxID=392033 RepID=A0A813V5F6_9BILA|nr:unnamed protein product [Rotaria sordida]CAF0833135.1 unnamed protein product [Rotaria sordida]